MNSRSPEDADVVIVLVDDGDRRQAAVEQQLERPADGLVRDIGRHRDEVPAALAGIQPVLTFDKVGRLAHVVALVDPSRPPAALWHSPDHRSRLPLWPSMSSPPP